MRSLLRTSWVLAIAALGTSAIAAPPDDSLSSKTFGFLQADKDYVIRFPEASDIFKTSRAEITEATTTTDDGQTKSAGPVTWNITLSVTVFHIVRFGGGSWVLLRHPTDPDDFLRWSAQRRALAILAGPHVEAIRAKPDGPERLKKLREAANATIPTSETWVNLNHAIAIADVPTVEDEPKLSIKSIKVNPKD